ncbi:MAG: hypothetical protein A2445_02840 [Candidatus Jacksonbacteria bacterium RIFOXYC2_FULL_44_29]|nr:MAG: Septum formation initiator [Parcubacteria group bacterium GW2011_GWC2_44_22]OGY75167.1 MAG: hypothetical protein A2240_01015 [Candidatus Jacksonbacteria bacterium RIFOXYA2_FULL_43_12]OGY77155.1 MAG: hypothetical protein A2445_02840 [Candidatus Jacksonbacteria bacterium RIFOXYC2_FULL_44_29]OGY77939.1 MAG: hypothetical protein A2295_01005 [Candidatus Jacksonbacteria bacterium RIFOXYB2_FULL_44_15]OGY79503.1 MAG: hypothetical protein A2550_02020 [Candidatus Jacksonbacteria bacterium RIFOXYD
MVKIFRSKIFLGLEIVLLVVAIVALIKFSAKNKTIQAEIADWGKQVAMMENENQNLEKRLQEIKQDSYVELEAKKKLNYRRPDETVFVFYEENSQGQEMIGPRPSGRVESDNLSNPTKWWRYFFGSDKRTN